eukprot:11162139-Lingulodinium_polyedra.AAC.1
MLHSTRGGHRIFLKGPQVGQRRSAIIVHAKFEGSVGACASPGRSMGLKLHWDDKDFVLINSYLNPYHNLGTYEENLGE